MIQKTKARLYNPKHREQRVEDTSFNPEDTAVAYWVIYGNLWPSDFIFKGRAIATEMPAKLSNSTHDSARLKRMRTFGVFMDDSRKMTQASMDLCDTLQAGDISPPLYPMYPQDKRNEVVYAMHTESETMIQTFITPIVLPTVAALRWNGRINLEHFGDEINALWTRADTIGSIQPRPNYVAGLRECSFDPGSWEKLMNYANPARPFLLSPLNLPRRSKPCTPLQLR